MKPSEVKQRFYDHWKDSGNSPLTREEELIIECFVAFCEGRCCIDCESTKGRNSGD